MRIASDRLHRDSITQLSCRYSPTTWRLGGVIHRWAVAPTRLGRTHPRITTRQGMWNKTVLDRVLKARGLPLTANLNWVCIFLGFHRPSASTSTTTPCVALGLPLGHVQWTPHSAATCFRSVGCRDCMPPACRHHSALTALSVSARCSKRSRCAVGGKVAAGPIPLRERPTSWSTNIHRLHDSTSPWLILLKACAFTAAAPAHPRIRRNLGFRFPCDGPRPWHVPASFSLRDHCVPCGSF